ncbi:DNA-binding protein [Clostridium sp.]|uniref:DNA-binding protein n=1 Tax=Clostridium sp. TaxID=1506 RepID=UPI003217EC07
MDYITAQEAAEKWKITRRRVQILCVEGRVEGAIKKANLWLIPINVEKPLDKRKTRYCVNE